MARLGGSVVEASLGSEGVGCSGVRGLEDAVEEEERMVEERSSREM